MVLVSDVYTNHIATMSTLDFLLTDDLASFVLQRALQEGYPAIPLGDGDPVVGLLVEEGKVRNLLA